MSSCAGQTNPRAAIDVLKEAFSPRKVVVKEHLRGKEMNRWNRWVEETLHRGFRVRLTADRVLFDSETEHQRLIIFENADFGRVMMLDSIVQLTTKDEFIYHEMMSHVPLFAHGKARKALIVGGGDGGVLRECLRHPRARAGHAVRDRPRRDRSLPPALPGDVGRRL